MRVRVAIIGMALATAAAARADGAPWGVGGRFSGPGSWFLEAPRAPGPTPSVAIAGTSAVLQGRLALPSRGPLGMATRRRLALLLGAQVALLSSALAADHSGLGPLDDRDRLLAIPDAAAAARQAYDDAEARHRVRDGLFAMASGLGIMAVVDVFAGLPCDAWREGREGEDAAAPRLRLAPMAAIRSDMAVFGLQGRF